MLNSTQDILGDIDATLDTLIENASAMECLSENDDFHEEMLALGKMQESLLAHLKHLDDLLEEEALLIGENLFETLEEKFETFGKLNSSLLKKSKQLNRRVEKPKKVKVQTRNRKARV